MRQNNQPFNTNWNFIKTWDDSLITNFKAGDSVHIPHAMEEIPLHYADETKLWLISAYQQKITYNPAWQGKRVIIKFDGVSSATNVYLNGKEIYEHKCAYTPFEVDLTDSLKSGENLLTVKVDSNERKDIPPFGGQIDYLCYNGIYREVNLYVANPVSLHELLLSQVNALTNPTITGHIRLRNTLLSKETKEIKLDLCDGDKTIATTKISAILNGSASQDVSVSFAITKDSIELWDLHSPKLYTIKATMNSDSGDDVLSRTIGFREAKFTAEGFYLNGNLVKIIGLNRHQSYPFVGYAMSERPQKRDADILKNELNLNLVRTSHYPQSEHFLNRCDEIGLLVFEEIPGWQHIGDKNWQAQSVKNVKDMIERDLHHPSIILWGVRINESNDNHDFYTETNRIAKLTDPTRQTSGVRCIADSELLEDVYAMNDFVQNHEREALRGQKEVTGLPHNVPYMVSEYNGHMYPTRMYDNEERLVEHTKRHYNVLASSAADKNISGTIGWCAFDYHTHNDFGAGDRICYHGVMDMFRNPKFAASAYASQNSPKPYLKALTVWARGEKSECAVLPLMVSTNCDYIKFYCDGDYRGTFAPAVGRYRSLKHPPIIIEDRTGLTNRKPVLDGGWGCWWFNGTIEGYIGDKCVITEEMPKSPVLANLQVKADDNELKASVNGTTWDSTRINVLALDQNNRQLLFSNVVINISVEGATLIGDDTVAMEGGSYAFWIKTVNKGTVKITVKSPLFKEQTISINVK